MRNRLLLLAVLAADAAVAEDSSLVVKVATGEVLVDDSALPKAGIGFWRLEPGSTVEAKDGFVEIGVGEGAWLRLRPGASFRFVAESAQAIEIDVEKGAVSLDVLRKPEAGAILLKVGGSALIVDDKGEYLAEASPGRFAAIKGKATVRASGTEEVLKSKSSIAADGSGSPEKMAKLEKDAFEEWREERNREFILDERRANTFAERTIRPARQ